MLIKHANGLVAFDIADDSPLALTLTRRDLIAEAEAQNADAPQYRGHWDGAEWRVARVRKDVRTKMGLAFAKGDVVLARAAADDPWKDERLGLAAYATAYSARNRIDTSVPERALEWLA